MLFGTGLTCRYFYSGPIWIINSLCVQYALLFIILLYTGDFHILNQNLPSYKRCMQFSLTYRRWFSSVVTIDSIISISYLNCFICSASCWLFNPWKNSCIDRKVRSGAANSPIKYFTYSLGSLERVFWKTNYCWS